MLPHQVDFIDSVLQAGPRSRVLLADPVGLGKTHASAALVWAWARDRRRSPRALVVAPGPLVRQWEEELVENATEAQVVDAAEFRRLEARTPSGENPWEAVGVAITSIDFVKQHARMRGLLDAPWDLVIVDEAQVASAGSQRARVLEGLLSSARADLVVALSATPLDPATPSPFDLVIRRSPGDVRDWDGRPILEDVPDRVVSTVSVALSSEERELLEAVRATLEQSHSEGATRRFQAEAFARAAGSSVFALEQSLRRAIVRHAEASVVLDEADEEVPPEESDGAALEVADRAGHIPRDALDALLELVDRLTVDSKWAACAETLERLQPDQSTHALVFCDLADTAHYVTGLLAALERPVALITGATPPDDRHRVIESFRTDGGILVITSSASEGFSFSFVKLCIHYDLPWNPTVLAQRLGRVHRIGAPPGPVTHVMFSDEVFRTDLLAKKLLSFEEALGVGAGAWLAQVLERPGGR
ncbi:MAG: DEAD/DEAH box helicase [Acidimicrobiia bacterium]